MRAISFDRVNIMDKKTQQELLNIVKDNYEEGAEEFDITRQKALWPELLALADSVKEGDGVLDVGSGNGRLLKAWLGKKIKYLGVDPSSTLIEFSNKNFTELNTDSLNYKFIVGNVLELGKIPDINFDFVFCVAVLHHLPGADLQISALKQIKNKIKPDGRIILTVWNMWAQKKFRKLIWKYFFLKIFGKNNMDIGDIIFDLNNSQKQVISRRYYHAFRRAELKKIVKAAGLKLEKLYRDEHNFYMILKK